MRNTRKIALLFILIFCSLSIRDGNVSAETLKEALENGKWEIEVLFDYEIRSEEEKKDGDIRKVTNVYVFEENKVEIYFQKEYESFIDGDKIISIGFIFGAIGGNCLCGRWEIAGMKGDVYLFFQKDEKGRITFQSGIYYDDNDKLNLLPAGVWKFKRLH